jgi:hypothetical protein
MVKFGGWVSFAPLVQFCFTELVGKFCSKGKFFASHSVLRKNQRKDKQTHRKSTQLTSTANFFPHVNARK